MSVFRNVWTEEGEFYPTSECVDCGARVHSAKEMMEHQCPQSKTVSTTEKGEDNDSE